MDKRKLLQIPKGTESFELEEAYIHKKIVGGLLDLFYRWGFLPIETPVFDFYDIYSNVMDRQARDRVYRLIDRDGELLMLRSDITLFMAKQIGLLMPDSMHPLRVCYADTILRYQKNEDISHNEFFQAGAEFIGKDGLEADLEVILLLLSSLKLLGIEDSMLHIGSRNLFNLCVSTAAKNTEGPVRKQLLKAVRVRDWNRFNRVLEENELNGEGRNFIELFSFIGTGKELKQMFNSKYSGETSDVKREVGYLVSVYEYLEKLNFADNVKIDLSELGGQDYYSGLSFKVYLKDVDTAIASGGRYNNLLSSFGYNAPAVGFSIMLRKVERVKKAAGQFKKPDVVTFLDDPDFLVRYRKAEKLRNSGRIVCL